MIGARLIRVLTVAVGGLALVGVLAPGASAHIQVTPARVAPNDPVLFQVIVPNEGEKGTTKVTLKIPDEVIPFSFEDAPGWTRTNVTKADGSIDQIEWKGKLASDGFVRFGIFAGTPERVGDIVWKAIQTYDGGEDVRWIGEQGSDYPAPVTVVAKDAPRQNAGGEGAQDTSGSDAQGVADITPTTGKSSKTKSANGDGGGTDVPARVAGIAGLGLGLLALVIALGRGRATKD